jgi:hypothetical protein
MFYKKMLSYASVRARSLCVFVIASANLCIRCCEEVVGRSLSATDMRQRSSGGRQRNGCEAEVVGVIERS